MTEAAGAGCRPAPVHPTALSASDAIPPQVEVDAALAFAVQVACPHGCDLRGLPIEMVTAEGVVASAEVVRQDDAADCSAEIQFRAPRGVGEHAWTVRFPRHEGAAAVHEESTLAVRFRTVSIACSLTAWGAPSPATAGGALRVHVGMRSGRACRLTGARVALLDDAGMQVGDGVLGETPWPGTDALYWTVVEARAPAAVGVHAWTAVLLDAATELPHAAPPAAFGFRTGKPCEHRAAVRVVEAEGREPVAGVEVRVGPYTAATNAVGIAVVAVPRGAFEVTIRKDGLDARPRSVAVDGDLQLDIEARVVPTRVELRERAIRDFPWG